MSNKPDKVKIIQIAPVMTDQYNYLFGLGDDGLPYKWLPIYEKWELHKDAWGQHQMWEYSQKQKAEPVEGSNK